MARFLMRSVVSTLITMLIVSIVLFTLLEVSGRDVTIQILGVFATPEQRESLRKQLGLDQPAYIRYTDWLIGNDWRLSDEAGNLQTVFNEESQEPEWYVLLDDGRYVRHQVCNRVEDIDSGLCEAGQLLYLVRQPDGTTRKELAGDLWQTDPETGELFFWGVDTGNRAAKWVEGDEATAFVSTQTGVQELKGAAVQWVPLRKGLIRGDAGVSLKTTRPVSKTLPVRIRNTAVLAGLAFIVVMPLALFLGIMTGINEGKFFDRFVSVTSLALTATPEFVTGVLLILIVGIYWSNNWLPGLVEAGWLPEAWLEALKVPTTTLADSPNAIFEKPKELILPVLTLTAVELGYIIRMTRASMVEVMAAPYIRTAIIKGMPFRRVVVRHAVRNALLAPITIIMLHINYLIGGIVVVEVIFGFQGLGKFIFDHSIFGDPNAVEAAAMVTVLIAVATRLLGDLAYTFLNPRIRYA
ncbi:MAG: ABC transporter permease [Chloroflexota bacterium]